MTPVEVSLWGNAYASTPASATSAGCVPGADSRTTGGSRWGAAASEAANFDENSPKLRASARRSTSPKTSASQNVVVPPLPRSTS